MPRLAYKGSVTTTGTSEAIRFEKGLFRQNPEFSQKSNVEAHVIGRGTLLVHVVDDGPEQGQERHEDPMIGAFLAFIERDATDHPERVVPLSSSQVARGVELTHDVVVSDDDEIPDGITL
jgi:antitoxin PrlF